MSIKTYGDLMDMANTTANNDLKTMLRDHFQKWCRAHHALPMDPKSIFRWRAEYISSDDAGSLIMTAFGL